MTWAGLRWRAAGSTHDDTKAQAEPQSEPCSFSLTNLTHTWAGLRWRTFKKLIYLLMEMEMADKMII